MTAARAVGRRGESQGDGDGDADGGGGCDSGEVESGSRGDETDDDGGEGTTRWDDDGESSDRESSRGRDRGRDAVVVERGGRRGRAERRRAASGDASSEG